MRVLLAVFITLLLFLAALATFAGWCWYDLNSPVQVRTDLQVDIPTGYTPDEIVVRLNKLGVIRHTVPLKLYMKLTHAGARFKAGEYTFPSSLSPLGVLRILESGGKPFGRLTVIEGWTRWDIAQAMTQFPSLHLKNKEQALKLMNNCTSIKDLDKKAKNLEGYLFPDTYFFDSRTTAQQLIDQMVAHFHEIWKDKLALSSAKAGLTAHDVVTVASLIETEAKLKGERPVIASVIYNRLGQKTALAVDSSLIYAARLANTWKNDGKVYQSDIDRESPYNTRKNTGLPPGPIGSPGLAALLAAINPARTDYIYYVRNPARNDGAHNFYSSASGFELGVQALRKWEQDQLKAAKTKNQTKSLAKRDPKS